MTVKDLAEMFPERFSNKTNGVTPRRWLLLANPSLSRAITELAGKGLLPDLTEPLRLLTRLLVTLRLVAPDAKEPDPATRALVARAVGAEDWADVLARFEAARQEVAAAWARVSEESWDE